MNSLKKSTQLTAMAAADRALLLFQEINRNLKAYESVLAIIGAFFVGKNALVIGYHFLKAIRVHFLSKLYKKNFRQYGKWAVVTGCTDGIGKAYARELARHGLSIILISRNLEKLNAVAAEIEKDFKVETFVIQANFSMGREIYKDIADRLKDKEIGVLVNNVGTMYDYPSPFLYVPEDKHWDLIHLNMASVIMMTYIIMPQMVQRKKGVVINMSSISSFYPLPLMTGYSASKAFVDWFSRGLEFEYRHKGIIVQSLFPSYVATKLLSFANVLQRANFIVPDAETFAHSAINTVGLAKKTTGYWSHGLQFCMYEMTPEWVWYITSWWWQKSIDTHKKPK